MKVVLALLLSLVALALALSPNSQAGDGLVRTGQFNVNCDFSHRLNDDPIVHPGQPGASHTHDFFGNKSVDANSTLFSLSSADTTCDEKANKSGYWLTALRDAGVTKTMDKGFVYYRAGNVEGPIQAPPRGLKVVAGNASATSMYPNAAAVITGRCHAPGRSPKTDINLLTREYCAPDATWKEGIQIEVRFPNCWNGTTLDSADHKSHMAYASAGKCPSTHPVPIPQIQVIAHYHSTYGGALSFSAGNQWSLHADYFAAWDVAQCGTNRIQELIDKCLNANRDCGNAATTAI